MPGIKVESKECKAAAAEYQKSLEKKVVKLEENNKATRTVRAAKEGAYKGAANCA